MSANFHSIYWMACLTQWFGNHISFLFIKATASYHLQTRCPLESLLIADRRVEILGFTQNKILEYMRKMFGWQQRSHSEACPASWRALSYRRLLLCTSTCSNTGAHIPDNEGSPTNPPWLFCNLATLLHSPKVWMQYLKEYILYLNMTFLMTIFSTECITLSMCIWTSCLKITRVRYSLKLNSPSYCYLEVKQQSLALPGHLPPVHGTRCFLFMAEFDLANTQFLLTMWDQATGQNATHLWLDKF